MARRGALLVVLVGVALVGVAFHAARRSPAGGVALSDLLWSGGQWAEGQVDHGGDALADFVNVAYSTARPLFGGRNMELSPLGLQLIMQHEGLRLDPYHDAAGYPTIGYGHKLSNERWAALSRWPRISEAEAARLLAQDAQTAVAAVNARVSVPLDQAQFDSLVSFVYNVGPGAFGRSTLLRKLNAGDYAGAAQEFGRWVYAGPNVAPGLVTRRAAEALHFAGGGIAGGVYV